MREERRGLRVWEELLVECRLLLLTVVLQDTSNDVWTWLPDPGVGYSVRRAYRILTSSLPDNQNAPLVCADHLWRRDIPLKVSVFVWRLFRNRLPTKVNLFHRGVIHNEAQMCVSGCGLHECSDHLFLLCNHFGKVWHLVRQWLGVYIVDPPTLVDHFIQFGTSAGFSKARCSFMRLIWFATSWVIWKERNARLFWTKENSYAQLLENIRLLSYSWHKTKYLTFHYKFHDWCLNPLLCVGLG